MVTNAIQTSAAINPGNSGGALVNASGQLVGINSAIASLGSSGSGQSGSIGIGFAIPANEAKSIASQLISSGKAEHAFLGVSLGDGTASDGTSQRAGAQITAISANTPAADAGLQKGDVVVAVDVRAGRLGAVAGGQHPRTRRRRQGHPDRAARRQAGRPHRHPGRQGGRDPCSARSRPPASRPRAGPGPPIVRTADRRRAGHPRLLSESARPGQCCAGQLDRPLRPISKPFDADVTGGKVDPCVCYRSRP